MLVMAVLNLYTRNPRCPGFRAWAEQLKHPGVLVFLHPLARLKQRGRPESH